MGARAVWVNEMRQACGREEEGKSVTAREKVGTILYVVPCQPLLTKDDPEQQPGHRASRVFLLAFSSLLEEASLEHPPRNE